MENKNMEIIKIIKIWIMERIHNTKLKNEFLKLLDFWNFPFFKAIKNITNRKQKNNNKKQIKIWIVERIQNAK